MGRKKSKQPKGQKTKQPKGHNKKAHQTKGEAQQSQSQAVNVVRWKEYEIVQTVTDGNCLFDAVYKTCRKQGRELLDKGLEDNGTHLIMMRMCAAIALHENKDHVLMDDNPYADHPTIRTMPVVQGIKPGVCTETETEIMGSQDFDRWELYLERLRTDRVWGESKAAAGLALAFGTVIRIHEDSGVVTTPTSRGMLRACRVQYRGKSTFYTDQGTTRGSTKLFECGLGLLLFLRGDQNGAIQVIYPKQHCRFILLLAVLS